MTDPTFHPGGDPRQGQRQPTGVKPVLVEVPANYADLTEDQRHRFSADLAAMLLGTKPAGEPVYRPENEEEPMTKLMTRDELIAEADQMAQDAAHETADDAAYSGFTMEQGEAMAARQRALGLAEGETAPSYHERHTS